VRLGNIRLLVPAKCVRPVGTRTKQARRHAIDAQLAFIQSTRRTVTRATNRLMSIQICLVRDRHIALNVRIRLLRVKCVVRARTAMGINATRVHPAV